MCELKLSYCEDQRTQTMFATPPLMSPSFANPIEAILLWSVFSPAEARVAGAAYKILAINNTTRIADIQDSQNKQTENKPSRNYNGIKQKITSVQ